MPSVDRLLFGDHRDPVDGLVEVFAADSVEQTKTVAVDRAVEWGQGVLATAGVSAEDQVSAIAALRKAEPRLGLKSATYLSGLLRPAQHAEDGGH